MTTDNEQALLNALGEVEEQIKALTKKKEELRSALGPIFEQREGTGALVTDQFVFKYRMNAGRKSLDKKAVEEAGIDLDPFYKVGKPFMTLSSSRLT